MTLVLGGAAGWLVPEVGGVRVGTGVGWPGVNEQWLVSGWGSQCGTMSVDGFTIVQILRNYWSH